MKKNSIGSSALVALGFTLCVTAASLPANAKNYDYGHADNNREIIRDSISQNSNRVIDNHRQSLNDAADRIIEALRSHSGTQTYNANAGERAASNREDVRDAREVVRRVEDQRMQAINGLRGGAAACNMITGLMGSSALFRQTAATQAHLSAGVSDYFTGSSSATQSSRGAGPGREERIAAICSRFATQAMIDAGVCPVGSPVESRPSFGGPDRPSSAFDANVFMGPDSSSMSKTQEEAARLFLATILAPTPMGALPPNAARTERGRENLAMRQASETRISIATNIMGAAQARRTSATSGLTDATMEIRETGEGSDGNRTTRYSIRDFMEGTAKRMIGYRSEGGNFPNGVSRQAWDEVRAKSFYLDPEFQKRLSGQDANQNSKDIGAMMSFQIYLQWEQYLQAEKTNIALATLIGIMEEQNRRSAMAER
jgi:hypothetical protein